MADELKTKERGVADILQELIESLTQSAGAASQLIHNSGNPVAFMTIREGIELMKEGVMLLMPGSIITGKVD
jgi:hypothetical protein